MAFLQIYLQILLLVFALAGVAIPLWRERQRYHVVIETYVAIGWRIWLAALAVLLGVIVLAFIALQIPILQIGWFTMITGHTGNAAVAPITDMSKSASLLLRIVPIVFLIALLFIMPFVVRIEEEMFRAGHVKLPAMVCQSVKFGLMHCILGIPLGIGMALSLAGMFFAIIYRRAALENGQEAGLWASTAAHTAYNAWAICIGLLVALVAVVGAR